jgi:maltooligosyltrehalose trehalohydrolase
MGFPDPYSRYQPEGPHGPSEVVDPSAFEWTDQAWPGLNAERLVIYECHVGVYTARGTFDALIDELPVLQSLGITAIELMPVAEVPGTRNWGYDGVDIFAPTRNYGDSHALRRLVNAAHALGMGIILDVVYNHFGPDGNYLLQFSSDYLTDRHSTPWGDAINFDGPNSARVRQYVIDNACYWLNEFHIDGLRLDATFSIYDDSPRHILAELTASARASVNRPIVLIAETYENDARYTTPEDEGGFGFDAVWVDDFHHVTHTAASHEQSGYYQDYRGTIDELTATINRGWLFEGQYSDHLASHRGTPAGAAPASRFVYFIQNHDQVGNRAFGRRLSHLVGPAAQKPWAALALLLPYTPMIFAGEEFAASSRFYYFTDHSGDLGREVTAGRRAEITRLLASSEGVVPDTPDPQAEQTFLESRLDLSERRQGVGEQIFRLYEALLELRRTDPVLRRHDREQMRAIAANEQLMLVHIWFAREHRLLALNTGNALDKAPESAGIPDALASMRWTTMLSTDERRFGGIEDAARLDARLVSLPAQSAVLFGHTQPAATERLFARIKSLFERLRSR